MSVEFIVYGVPAPQGSKRLGTNRKTGRAILIESSDKVKPWREAVKWAAIETRSPKFEGPLSVQITFNFICPKRCKSQFKTTRPDLDKLIRSTLDALTDSGIIQDDSQVAVIASQKVFADKPGAVITIERLPNE